MVEQKSFPGGLLVIFEGLDGVGKTTQLQLAHKSLQESGWNTHATRNLGGTPIGEELRKVILGPLPRPVLTDTYIGAAVQEALVADIEERRSQNQVILMDRGPMSFAAYTSGDKERVWNFADDGINKFKPELIIYYTLDIDKASKRISSRGKAKNYFEDKPKEYYETVQSLLNSGADRYKAVRISGDNTIENIHEQTMDHINTLLNA